MHKKFCSYCGSAQKQISKKAYGRDYSAAREDMDVIMDAVEQLSDLVDRHNPETDRIGRLGAALAHLYPFVNRLNSMLSGEQTGESLNRTCGEVFNAAEKLAFVVKNYMDFPSSVTKQFATLTREIRGAVSNIQDTLGSYSGM